MGGVVPLGYEVKERKLVIVPEEAEKVHYIFKRYLELGSVYALEADLASKGIRTKERTLKDGRPFGGKNFSRWALYLMLANRIYLGEITHRGKAYPGEHDAIIDTEIFERVRSLLVGNRVDHRHAIRAEHPSLLAGILWDNEGRRMTPNHANKKGARYRYYISRKDKERLSLPVHRVPAGDIENLVTHQLCRQMDIAWDTPSPARELILEHIDRIIVHPDHIDIRFLGIDEPVKVNASLVRCSGETRIATAPENQPSARRDAALIKLLVRAHQARKALTDPSHPSLETAATSMQISNQYFCTLLRLSYLAPDITAAILEGRQPAFLNRQYLARITNLPVDWASQRIMLGFT